jgi:hypothetical protein
MVTRWTHISSLRWRRMPTRMTRWRRSPKSVIINPRQRPRPILIPRPGVVEDRRRRWWRPSIIRRSQKITNNEGMPLPNIAKLVVRHEQPSKGDELPSCTQPSRMHCRSRLAGGVQEQPRPNAQYLFQRIPAHLRFRGYTHARQKSSSSAQLESKALPMPIFSGDDVKK